MDVGKQPQARRCALYRKIVRNVRYAVLELYANRNVAELGHRLKFRFPEFLDLDTGTVYIPHPLPGSSKLYF